MVIDKVDVAAQHTAQPGQVGHHVAQFAQVDVVHTQGNIVGRGVGLAVEGEGRSVVGHKVNVIFRYTSGTAVAGTWEIKNLRVAVTHPAAVDSILADPDDEDAPVEYYSIDGRRLDPETATGIVIIRRGNKVTKTILR